MTQQRWPQRLWVVRHGESAGNLARRAAMSAGRTHIETSGRDADVPLSALGERQSRALGRWFAEMPESERPDVVLTSPYRRARQTAALMHAAGGLVAAPADFQQDERLREKEFGVLDRLTTRGIARHHPEQAEFRRVLGKFYHRPPGGESWCDVILRLRSAMDGIALRHGGARVLIVAHQVVVLCLRYLIEGLDEEAVLAIDAEGDVANCGLSEYGFDPARGRDGGPVLLRWNFVAPLHEQGAPVTAEPDAPAGAR
ncbi:histidine phosphatase family protein [Paracraurococcus ruber]|uniref:Histidine phosphatase family protein n=1 Tax=Paracraurococcus ruber TaxID=77675 RepID=A0ABS1D2K9_9PROT|nr:histidine phosphatase family protein [Paracraurococcus ruber]MBK1660502.1 histidine phosphatase family protein [Paracraurococcus ruber]TDG27458.1 histidine phosphatase family protein [Paracraurococcus ruber]